MKNLITILLAAFLPLGLFAQEKVEQEPVDRSRQEPTLVDKRATPKPYTGKYASAFAASRGGSSTDCYSFVPVPDDAIELDFTSGACAGGGALDAAYGPFDLDFDFCHFGDLYSEVTISNKGNIQFDACDFTFVPAGFPNNGLPMVAAFWADIDMSCDDCGSIYYWFTPTAAYFTWVDVGYWPGAGALGNTFQIVITDGTDPIVGVGNNVGLFYQDMQWAASNWNGGTGGFGGTAAATVGANKGDGLNYIQFGRFISNTDDYDGPFGDEDGVHWLDDKAFVFNICSTADNIPPIPNVTDNCDTIFICQNDTYEFNVSFNAPEGAQVVTVTADDSDAPGWTETDSGDGYMTGFIEGGPDNIGSHTMLFTGTDNGTPEASTTVVYVVEVTDVELPDLVVTGDGLNNDIVSFCGGTDGAEVTAADGFDFYDWGGGITGQTALLDDGGEYNLSAFYQGCEANYGPITVLETPFYNPGVVSDGLNVCSGQNTNLILEDFETYDTVEWSLYVDDNNETSGEIESDDLNAEEILVTEGVYQVDVTDENGCPGTRIIPIGLIPINPGTIPDVDCGEKEICWSGAWAAADPCTYQVQMWDSGNDSWEGANLEVYLDGLGPLNFTNTGVNPTVGGFTVLQGQTIEMYYTGGLDPDENSLMVFECGSTSPIFDSFGGDDELTESPEPFFTTIAQTPLSALTGTWSTSNANGTFSCADVFNPVEGTCCYSVPEDYLGTDNIIFSADICPLELEYELLFSLPLEMTLDQTNYTLCSDDGGALIAPTYFPPASIDPITYDWDPNFDCEGNPDCLITTSAAYSIEGENSCGEDEIEGFIVINPTPQVNLTDAELCAGQTLTLNPGDNDGASCVWSDGSTGSALTVSQSGTYSVECTNDCGTAEGSANITVAPSVGLWAFDSLVCAGEFIDITPDWNNLTSAVSWTMNYIDTTGAAVGPITLNGTGPDFTFLHSQIPADALDNTVTVTYSASDNCPNASQSTIIYSDACFIAAANVFTPDNDGSQNGFMNGGLNEGWHITGIDGIAGISVKIYDRWGALVYENANYSNDQPWTGKHKNGSDLAEGVYFYTIETPRKSESVEGTVTILRQ